MLIITMRNVADFANNVWPPNIYGTVDGYQALETATGAFSIDNMAGSPVGTEVMKNHRFLFNASLYSTMYQNGATVQAPALSALPCIRY